MLIAYERKVVNLDKCTDFIKDGEGLISFYDKDKEITFFRFDKEKQRDRAFIKILECYEDDDNFCNLDED